MNNKLKLVSLALVAPMMFACTPRNSKPSSTSPSSTTGSSTIPNELEWSEEIQEQMDKFIGEVLPYAELDEETLTYGYDDTWGGFGYFSYDLTDTNETNVLEEYAEELEAAGFEYTETEIEDVVYISYDKVNSVGYISVEFGWAEAEGDNPAGNYISVSIPEYIDIDLLLEYGYELQEGWPAQMVAEALEKTGVTISPINEEGDWYAYFDVYVDDEDGSFYACAYLVTEGHYVEEISDDLEAQGFDYDYEYGCYYDTKGVTDAEIYPSYLRGFTLINIYGQTMFPTLDYQGDALDQAAFGLTSGVTTYGNHSALGASGATYSAQCASQYGIQIRSKNSNSGIIGSHTTKTCESITVLFESHTQSGRVINVYGSNTAFTISDMYGSMTPVGTIAYNGSSIASYEFTTDYKYIGLRSADGAIYISGIDVVWSD